MQELSRKIVKLTTLVIFLLATGFGGFILGGLIGYKGGYSSGKAIASNDAARLVLNALKAESVEGLPGQNRRLEESLDVLLTQTVLVYDDAEDALFGFVTGTAYDKSTLIEILEYRKAYPTPMTGEAKRSIHEILRHAEGIVESR